jgi:hypothetical protein
LPLSGVEKSRLGPRGLHGTCLEVIPLDQEAHGGSFRLAPCAPDRGKNQEDGPQRTPLLSPDVPQKLPAAARSRKRGRPPLAVLSAGVLLDGLDRAC